MMGGGWCCDDYRFSEMAQPGKAAEYNIYATYIIAYISRTLSFALYKESVYRTHIITPRPPNPQYLNIYITTVPKDFVAINKAFVFLIQFLSSSLFIFHQVGHGH